MEKIEIFGKIEEILGVPVDENTGRDNCEQWDSLNIIRVVMLIQSDYGVSIKAKDIENIVSVKDILDILEQQIK